jgi:hypothetical protein
MSTRALFATAVAGALCALSLGAGVAQAGQTSCGIVTASHRSWIVVAKNVPCAKAKSVTRALAARTAAVRAGQRRTVTTGLLPGFVCVLASQGKPGGSCSTAGAAKMVLWLSAT